MTDVYKAPTKPYIHLIHNLHNLSTNKKVSYLRVRVCVSEYVCVCACACVYRNKLINGEILEKEIYGLAPLSK